MKTAHFLLLFTLCVFSVSSPSNSQDLTVFNQISFLTDETGFGARALGLAGAYISVSDDYSAVYWNPAGLALMKEKEFFIALTNNSHSINMRILGSSNNSSVLKTSLGSIGYASPIPVYRGSLTIAFGYNRITDYNSLFKYRVYNPGESYMFRTFISPVVPDRLTMDEYVDIGGDLSQLLFALSYEALEHFFLGASINIWLGENNYAQVYQELDLNNLHQTVPDDFKAYKNEGEVDTNITGYSAVIGALYQFLPQLRIGAVLKTPRFITLEERWLLNERIDFDAPGVSPWVSDDGGEFKYKVRMPYMFGIGASFQTTGAPYPFLLTGEVNYNDWQQFYFRDNFPVAGYTKSDANRAIKETLEATLTYKAGCEFSIPRNSQIRLGYLTIPNPVRDAAYNSQKYLTFGFGTAIGPMAHLDIAFRHGWWKDKTTSQFNIIPVNEKHDDNKLFATLSFRFK